MLDFRARRLASVLVWWLWLAGHALAQTGDDAAYRKTTDEAVSEFDAGHWEEARALFKRAHEISPNARTLRGMGMAAFELRMYVQAIRELDAALRETRKPLDAELRAEVERLMEKAREFVGRVKLEPDPASAKLLVDGKPPELEPDGSLLLDVGTHVVSATADGFKPTNMRLNVEGGMDQIVRVPLEPLLALQPMVPAIDASKPPPVPTKQEPQPPAPAPAASQPPPKHRASLALPAWITLGSAGAFGATSLVFWLVGNGQYNNLKMSCSPSCKEQEINDSGVKTSDTLTNVFLGAAVAAGVASGILFAIQAGRSGEEHASLEPASVAVLVAPTGASLRGTF